MVMNPIWDEIFVKKTYVKHEHWEHETNALATTNKQPL